MGGGVLGALGGAALQGGPLGGGALGAAALEVVAGAAFEMVPIGLSE